MNIRRKAWRFTATAMIPMFIVAGCASSDDEASDAADSGDLKGKIVKIYGTEVDKEANDFLASFKPFEDRTGIDVQYEGDKTFETQIGVRVSGNNPPDIAMFPQPGKVNEFADDLKPLDDATLDTAKENFDAGWTDLVTIDGEVKAIPAKADLKSLVWYSPKAFSAAGYKVPTTQTEFTDLVAKTIADGKNAFCVGLGSGDATGWPFTDWTEDYILRTAGPDVYDQWVKHEIPFNDPKIVAAANDFLKIWNEPGGIYGGTKNAAATPFAEAGLGVLSGDCMMYKMANFYGANWPDGTTISADGDVNAFYFPGSEENPNITLTGGLYASAFTDRPEVQATMEYLASTEYANTRAPVGGFLSPNKNVDVSKYPDAIQQNFATILSEASPVRFDGSDQMPSEVGSAFWSAGVDITTGAKSVTDAFATVEAAWPSS